MYIYIYIYISIILIATMYINLNRLNDGSTVVEGEYAYGVMFQADGGSRKVIRYLASLCEVTSDLSSFFLSLTWTVSHNIVL